MASSADSANGEIAARPRNRGPQFKFLVPLIYAPVLPLIRIGLRRNPLLRDRLFTAVLAGGFLHGFYLVEVHSYRRLAANYYKINRKLRDQSSW